jgi:hypothetical protein
MTSVVQEEGFKIMNIECCIRRGGSELAITILDSPRALGGCLQQRHLFQLRETVHSQYINEATATHNQYPMESYQEYSQKNRQSPRAGWKILLGDGELGLATLSI